MHACIFKTAKQVLVVNPDEITENLEVGPKSISGMQIIGRAKDGGKCILILADNSPGRDGVQEIKNWVENETSYTNVWVVA